MDEAFPDKTAEQKRKIVELNSVDVAMKSGNKRLTQEILKKAGCKTADMFLFNDINISDLPYPVIVKHIHGSRGEGNTYIETQLQLKAWINGKTLSNYIIERYYTYSSEYRLHVSMLGHCFYTCRKMLKRDTPKENRFQRHDDNSIWVLESNPMFGKPDNWNDIVADCVRALKAMKADILAFDVKVQSNKDSKGKRRTNPDWIILESNSAASHGSVTTERYILEVPKVLREKAKLLV